MSEGAAVLTAIRDQRPDLVLLDVMLPGMSGSEIVGLLRAEMSRLPS
ncbi:response regulator [Paracoccus angustae]|uniref:Response regulator n=1 Tax=Paracoccus angustae TaxID=1671480 RepID=A0ABV7U8T6_9RHOB